MELEEFVVERCFNYKSLYAKHFSTSLKVSPELFLAAKQALHIEISLTHSLTDL
jgi:hypothetical protein